MVMAMNIHQHWVEVIKCSFIRYHQDSTVIETLGQWSSVISCALLLVVFVDPIPNTEEHFICPRLLLLHSLSDHSAVFRWSTVESPAHTFSCHLRSRFQTCISRLYEKHNRIMVVELCVVG